MTSGTTFTRHPRRGKYHPRVLRTRLAVRLRDLYLRHGFIVINGVAFDRPHTSLLHALSPRAYDNAHRYAAQYATRERYISTTIENLVREEYHRILTEKSPLNGSARPSPLPKDLT